MRPRGNFSAQCLGVMQVRQTRCYVNNAGKQNIPKGDTYAGDQMHRTTPSLLHYLDIIGTMGAPRMLWLCSYPPLHVGGHTRDFGPIKQRANLA